MTRPVVRVLLAGEGPNELGGWFAERQWRREAPEPGVLEALLRAVVPDGWEIADARVWSRIRRLRVGAAHGDERNVFVLGLDAAEADCALLVFSRDRDNDATRAEAVRNGKRRIAEELGEPPRVVGEVAVPKLEGWILALMGTRRTESLRPARAESDLEKKGVAPKDTSAMVATVSSADLSSVPADAKGLRAWLDSARDAFAALTKDA